MRRDKITRRSGLAVLAVTPVLISAGFGGPHRPFPALYCPYE
jgi:hypothetical protein